MATTLEVINSSQLATLNNKPVALIYQTAPQNFPSGSTYNAITYGAVVTDNWGGWSAGSPTRYTVKLAGHYRVDGSISVTGNGSGNRFIQSSLSGVFITGSYQELPGTGSALITSQTSSVAIFANVGEYFEVQYVQNSGITLTSNATNAATMLVEFMHF